MQSANSLQLLKHFAKEFTKKTKVTLDLPCGEGASDSDKRAEAKLRLAVEHTKRSLSASSGAATCAVVSNSDSAISELTFSQESLKEGMDLSTSINRLRFDGLAAGVYRQVGAKLNSVVKEAGLDLCQIDEVLLAGSSSLFPGLQQNLALLVSPTTPVTTTLDPSEAIAVGCALQALHLSRMDQGMKLDAVLALAKQAVGCTARPIGMRIPGQEGEELVKVVDGGAPLPVRRRVALPVQKGTEKVALEIWEGKDEVKVEKIERPSAEKVNGDADGDENEEDEDEEDEETKTPMRKKVTLLGVVEVEVKSGGNVILEIIVQRGGGMEVRAWEDGHEEAGDKFEL